MLISYLLASFVLFSQSTINTDDQFLQLKNQLESYGFKVILETSPVRGSYGLLKTSSKQIFIDPIVFQLGIAKPTLIHEAVHAAQYCVGNGEIQSLGLTIKPPNIARPYFTQYQDGQRRHLEAEAYAVQTQPDSFEMAMSLLEKYCGK